MSKAVKIDQIRMKGEDRQAGTKREIFSLILEREKAKENRFRGE